MTNKMCLGELFWIDHCNTYIMHYLPSFTSFRIENSRKGCVYYGVKTEINFVWFYNE